MCDDREKLGELGEEVGGEVTPEFVLLITQPSTEHTADVGPLISTHPEAGLAYSDMPL